MKECRVEVDAKDNDGRTALIDACEGGYIDIVRFLTQECEVDINTSIYRGFTAFTLAAAHGHIDVARYLFEKLHAAIDDKGESAAADLNLSRPFSPEVVAYLNSVCDMRITPRSRKPMLTKFPATYPAIEPVLVAACPKAYIQEGGLNPSPSWLQTALKRSSRNTELHK